MKKVLSVFLVVAISLSYVCSFSFSVYAEESTGIINISDIPMDWDGWYVRYGAHY